MQKCRSRAIVGALLFLALALAAFHAQSETPQSVGEYLAATRSDDASVTIFEKVIGSGRLSSPFVPGEPTGAIGKMFLLLNAFVFVVGVFFASYGIGAGIVQTAHEGQVLGRRMSAIWMPIRMVTGIAGLIPVFGGFSLSQAVMMLAAFLGIGLANYSWNSTLNGNGEGFSGLVAPAIGNSTAGSSPKELAYAMFLSEICRLSYAKTQDQNSTDASQRLVRYSAEYAAPNTKAQYFFGYGTIQAGVYKPTCGYIEIGPKNKTWDEELVDGAYGAGQDLVDSLTGATPGSSTLGYSINSVNYRGVATSVGRAAVNEARRLEQNMVIQAGRWFTSWEASLGASVDAAAWTSGSTTAGTGQGSGSISLPTDVIDGAAGDYMARIQSAGNGAKGGESVITQAAVENMGKYGWFGAGAWYSTLAQAQNALNDAMKNFEIKVEKPGLSGEALNGRAKDMLKAYEASYKAAAGAATSGDPWQDAFDTGFGLSNQTGNLSLGQRIATEFLQTVSGGTGGAGQMNPIVTLKNVGDYLMVSSQAIIFGAPLAKGWTGVATAVGEGVASEVAGSDSLPSKLLGALSNIASALTGMVMAAMGAIFVVGALLSIYIPFIPFIQWMGGLIQYVSIFFEGLLGAPIWAFAHLDAEGEGMGQRTERGYLFLLNMLFRPFLMVFGFVLAAAILPLLGTLQAILFVPAISNVQGNSVTGLASIFFLIAVFGLLNVTMIHGLFNLITLLPDQVIGWVGNITGQVLGKDTDDRANNLFLSVGRTTASSAASQMKPSSPQQPDIQRGKH